MLAIAAAPEVAAQKRGAPPPFSYVGTLDQGAERYAVLAARDQSVLVVRAGETIENKYRVQSVTDERLLLVNLASGAVETLVRSVPAAPVATESADAEVPPTPEPPSEAGVDERPSAAPETERARPGYGH